MIKKKTKKKVTLLSKIKKFLKKLMKKLFIFGLLGATITIFSCDSSKFNDLKTIEIKFKDTTTTPKEDSNSVKKIRKEMDSLITYKLDSSSKEFSKLKIQIKKLKRKNNELKENLDISNDIGEPYIFSPISDY